MPVTNLRPLMPADVAEYVNYAQQYYIEKVGKKQSRAPTPMNASLAMGVGSLTATSTPGVELI